MSSQVRTLQRLLLEKERECDLYIQLAAERLSNLGPNTNASSSGEESQLRDMLSEVLGVPRAGLSNTFFDGLVRKEVETLQSARSELQRRNLDRRGHSSPERAAAARRSAEIGQVAADNEEAGASELTTAIGNVNKVFDLLLKRRPPPADGEAHAKEELIQWVVLSGVMEEPKLRQLLALDGLSLPDAYLVIEQLFLDPSKGGGPAKGGGGKGGKATSIPDPPPIDRKRFETFFVVRHLGLLDALTAQASGKGGKGAEDFGARPNLAKVRWQDILTPEQAQQLLQAFDDATQEGVVHGAPAAPDDVIAGVAMEPQGAHHPPPPGYSMAAAGAAHPQQYPPPVPAYHPQQYLHPSTVSWPWGAHAQPGAQPGADPRYVQPALIGPPWQGQWAMDPRMVAPHLAGGGT